MYVPFNGGHRGGGDGATAPPPLETQLVFFSPNFQAASFAKEILIKKQNFKIGYKTFS